MNKCPLFPSIHKSLYFYFYFYFWVKTQIPLFMLVTLDNCQNKVQFLWKYDHLLDLASNESRK